MQTASACSRLTPYQNQSPFRHAHDLPVHAHGADLPARVVHLDVQHAGPIDLRALLAEDVGARLAHAHRLTQSRVRRGVMHSIDAQRAVGATGGGVLRYAQRRRKHAHVDRGVGPFGLEIKDHHTVGELRAATFSCAAPRLCTLASARTGVINWRSPVETSYVGLLYPYRLTASKKAAIFSQGISGSSMS